MAGRILTMQRTLREVGRIRSGYTGPKGPVRSKTWILTSKDRDLLDAAAQAWGGTVAGWTPLNRTDKQWSLTTETNMLPAQLPPGDPLSQANELWSGGGAQRRCDGITESKTGKPCLCLAQFGEDWHLQDKKIRCQPYSHLNLFLLNLPDVGQWRHVTKSFYAAGEIAGQVDLIKARIGPDPIVPVWLIIDPREKVADGKKTPYPVPVIKIRGAESGAALLSGDVPTLELGPARERAAIEAGSAGPEATVDSAKTVEQFKALARLARDPQTIRNLWERAKDRLVLNQDLADYLTARAQDLGAPAKQNGNGDKPVSAPPAPPAETVDPEMQPDRKATWMQVLALAGDAPYKWSTERLEQAVVDHCGKPAGKCDGWELAQFLDDLKNGRVK